MTCMSMPSCPALGQIQTHHVYEGSCVSEACSNLTVIESCLQGQKEMNVFAAACKALATVSTGKAAAKRAGKALEKVHFHSIFHVHVQQLGHKAQSWGLSLSSKPVLSSAVATSA
jgi:hypothetical protein